MYNTILPLFIFVLTESYFLVIQSNMFPFFIVFLSLVVLLILSTKFATLILDLDLLELENTTDVISLICLVSWHSFRFFKLLILLLVSFIFIQSTVGRFYKLSEYYISISQPSLFKIKPLFCNSILYFNFYINILISSYEIVSPANYKFYFISNSVLKLLV